MRGLLTILTSRTGSVWRNRSPEAGQFPSRQTDCLLDLRLLPGHWSNDSVDNYADLFTIALRNDDTQEFDSKWDGILLSMTKNPT